MNVVVEPYRAATPKAVTAFMCALYAAAGQSDRAEAFLASLTAMCAAARPATCEGQR